MLLLMFFLISCNDSYTPLESTSVHFTVLSPIKKQVYLYSKYMVGEKTITIPAASYSSYGKVECYTSSEKPNFSAYYYNGTDKVSATNSLIIKINID